MGIFRKFMGMLGFVKDEPHEHDSRDNEQSRIIPPRVQETGLPRQGPAQVVVDRPHLGPVLTPSISGDGGLQGLGWYAKGLRIDEDGDVADEFIDEVSSEKPAALAVDHQKTATRFKLKCSTKPIKVKQQILLDGKIQQVVELQGKLQIV
ncbi:hypothetical protein RJT34_05593 [Clitoria ternatea]|uniref:Uncharacterized protein n=1 Tax=Clitoria ternatea TaxID=43366 RepID=A0AAN9K2D7_CLITE